MIYEEHPADGAHLYPACYKFLEPIKLRIRRPSGEVETVGFGIGDSIIVMRWSCVYPVGPCKPQKEIPLQDGSTIIDCPSYLKVEYNGKAE